MKTTIVKPMEFGVKDYASFMHKQKKESKYDNYLKGDHTNGFMPMDGMEVTDICTNEIAKIMTFGWLRETKGRKLINGLKNIINRMTWEANAMQIAQDLNLAKSTALKYATKAYAFHYAKINTAMQEALEQFLDVYTNKL